MGDTFSILRNKIISLTLELTYPAWDLEMFAQDCGWNGPPFCWNEECHFLLRCEFDAAFFHLYLPITENYQWKPARKNEGVGRDEISDELLELKHYFPTPRHAVDRYDALKRSFKTACKKTGIRDFRFHDLRHTFSSHLIMSGIDITTV